MTKTTLITGSTYGIGRAIALELAKFYKQGKLKKTNKALINGVEAYKN